MPRFYRYSGIPELWRTVGILQFSFLREHGLEPESYLLDVGCGAFRLGRLVIPYLKPGHYYGIDRNGGALTYGRKEQLGYKMIRRRYPHIENLKLGDGPIDLPRILERDRFDIVWMHALLDHMKPAQVNRALCDVAPLAGDIYATAFVSDSQEPVLWEEKGVFATTYPDKDPFHYPMERLQGWIENAGLALVDVPGYGHPLGLTMLHLRSTPCSVT